MQDRIKKISEALNEGEAALLTGESTRLYLTGFHSSAGAIVVLRDGAYFFIDFRYFEKAQSCVKSCNVILMKKFTTQLTDFLNQKNIKTVYVETSRMSLDEFKRWSQAMGNFEFSSSPHIDSLLYELFKTKSERELKSITAAQQITDAGFEHILDFVREGISEREIALELEFYMRKMGSEGVAFDFIAVSGENSSLPHGVPTDRKLRRGDFLTLDFGAVVDGYRSDMTRTVAIGCASDEQKNVYNTVLKAQTAALEYLREGVKGCDADKVARDIIEEAGYGECFGHSLGHSVGVEIHESPTCSPACKDVLTAGTIMTVEPGIYIPEKFGVRIEDMVLIQKDGVKNFTKSPKNLIII